MRFLYITCSSRTSTPSSMPRRASSATMRRRLAHRHDSVRDHQARVGLKIPQRVHREKTERLPTRGTHRGHVRSWDFIRQRMVRGCPIKTLLDHRRVHLGMPTSSGGKEDAGLRRAAHDERTDRPAWHPLATSLATTRVSVSASSFGHGRLRARSRRSLASALRARQAQGWHAVYKDDSAILFEYALSTKDSANLVFSI